MEKSNIIAVSSIAVLGIFVMMFAAQPSGMATACTFTLHDLDIDTFEHFLTESESMPEPFKTLFSMHVTDHYEAINMFSSVPNQNKEIVAVYLQNEVQDIQNYGYTDQSIIDDYTIFIENMIIRILEC